MARGAVSLVCAAAIVFAGSVVASAAAAQPPHPPRPNSFAEKFGRARQALSGVPAVARFVADGVTQFTLDRSNSRPMVQFQGSHEIIVLESQSAPRGDLVFKNDVGDVVLRASGLGGWTVYTPGRPAGAPASMVGMGDPLHLDPRELPILGEQLNRVGYRLRAALGHATTVDFDVPPEARNLVIDVLNLTADAMERVQASDTQSHLLQIKHIEVDDGPRSEVRIEDATLKITVTPDLGIAGRPSSAKIARVLGR